MKMNQLKAGALLSYLQMALSMVVGVAYTPVMLRILGRNEYGLYGVVASTISMLSILNLGFGSSYIRYYARYRAENDDASIGKLNGLFIVVFGVIASVALLCGLYLSFHLELLFDKGLTTKEYATARTLTLLTSVNLAFTFLTSVFINIISAHEKFIFQKSINIIRTVVGPLVTLPILLLGYGSIGMVVVSVALSLLADACNVAYCFKKLNVKFVFTDWEKGIFKSLFLYTGFIAVNIVVDQINWNIGKILLGRYQGTASVAVYSIGYLLFQYYLLFSTSVSNVFTPRVHAIENLSVPAKEKNARHTELMIRVGRIQYLILGLVFGGLFFFGRPFIKLWAGEGYENSYYVCILLAASGTIALIQNVGIEIQRAKNKHYFRSIAYAIMAFVNLLASFFLCQKWGEIGVASGSAVSLILANGVIINLYYRHMGLDVVAFWKQIAKASLGLVPVFAFGWVLTEFAKVDGVVGFLIEATIFSVVYFIGVWFASMNEYEKSIFINVVQKARRKNA